MKKIESKKLVAAPAGSTSENKTTPNQLKLSIQAMKTQMSTQQFEQFLRNTYSQLTGRSFKSIESYVSYINRSIKYIGVDAVKFFNATLRDIKIWEFKLRDNPAFISLPYEHRSDILSGYHAYITCLRYKNGFIRPNNNK